MLRLRLSLARLLVLVLIAGLDCGLIRLFLSSGQGAQGVMGFGLAMSAGVVGWLIGKGRFRRFSAGFTVAVLLAAVALIAVMELVPGADQLYLGTYLNAVLRLVNASGIWRFVSDTSTFGSSTEGAEVLPSVAVLLVIEAVIVFPVLAVALPGGLLALVFRWGERPNLAPDPAPS